MTMSFSAGRAREQLSGREVRRGLTALLRRRVPEQEVDDVAQTVLCDALAAARVPADPEELRRWLTGIARHKIADFHRRAARAERPSVDREEAVVASPGTSPAVVEDREVLEGLLGGVRSGRDAQTMDWLIREHGGERLADIATENHLPAPVVRQRVSRLRRALRSRWASLVGASAFVLVLAATVALRGDGESGAQAGIVREPAAFDVAPSSAASIDALPWASQLEGDWQVQVVTPNRALSAAEERALDIESRSTSVHVSPTRIDLAATGRRKTWRVLALTDEAEPNHARLRLVNEAGQLEEVDVVVGRDVHGPRLDVTFRGPGSRTGALATLRRPVL